MSQAQSARGAHILIAAESLIAANGLAGLSMRAVATEAGVSLAQVQYYFGSKDALIMAALEHANTGFLSRISPLLEEPSSTQRLHDLIMHWLPVDPERERRVKVWLAFAALAPAHPALVAVTRETDRQLSRWIAEELETLGVDDPAPAAARLLALVDGLAIRCLTLGSRSRANLIRQVLDGYLQELLGDS